MTYSPRPYQTKAFEATRAALARERAVLLQLPTGAGKTHIAAMFIKAALAKSKTSFFVAHQEELITQPSRKLSEIGVSHSVIKAGYEHLYNPCSRVQVGSIQTMAARAKKLGLERMRPDLVILDEAHLFFAGGRYDKVFSLWPDAYFVGLTATPARLDGKGLAFFKQLITAEELGASIPELTQMGFLVPIRHFKGPKLDLSGIRKRMGDYDQGELGERMSRPKLVGNIIEHWRRHAAGLTTIAFCVTIAHSKLVRDMFLAAGVSAEHVDGSTPPDERRAIFARIESGQTLVLCNVGIATTGVDIPRASCAILAAPTMSLVKYMQEAGRFLRPCPEIGKTHAILLDHAGCYYTHGEVDQPREFSLAAGVKSGAGGFSDGKLSATIECPFDFCGLIFKRDQTLMIDGLRHCPACRAPLPVREITTDEGAQLEEVTPLKDRPPVTNPAARRKIYNTVAQKAFEQGHKPGSAFYKFKAITKTDPTADDMADSAYKIRQFRVKGQTITAWDKKIQKEEVNI